MATLLSLAGIPLSPTSGVRWAFTFGTDPFQSVINVERNRGLAIYQKAAGQPTRLIIGEEVIDGVYVTSTTAGTDRHHIGLVLQDVRWLWPATFIGRGYNVRQRTGEFQKRPSVDGKDLIENVRITNDAKYFEWSLFGPNQPWSLINAFEDAFIELGLTNYTITGLSNNTLPLEDFEEELPGDEFLLKLLQRAPGRSIFINSAGEPVVFDQTDRSEERVIESDIPPPIENTGWVEVSDRTYERPSSVDVLFTIEQEIRFDYNETSTVREVRGKEEPLLENVLPIPTKSLTVTNVSTNKKRELFEGSWITFQELYEADEVIPNADNGLTAPFSYIRRFDDQAIRKTYLTPYQLENRFIKDHDAGGEPIRFWADIVQGSFEHWRRTFRIEKSWRDRIRSYRANRVGVVDFENRARAPARAYTSYTAHPTKRMYHSAAVGDRYQNGWTFNGYRANLNDAEAIPAPSIIRIRDQDNGIIQVLLKKGPFGEEAKLTPGIPDQLPVYKSAGAIEPILLDDQVQLSTGWELAVIISIVKSAPNNNGKYYKVNVDPNRAESLLGQEIGDCFGPKVQVKISASPTTTARFIWDDDKSLEIKRSFWFGEPMPDELLSNKEHVVRMAEAAAASVYSIFLDRYEGGFDFTQKKNGRLLEVTGSIGTIVHKSLADSTVRTRIELPRIIEPRDLASFLPSEIKRAILGIVQP